MQVKPLLFGTTATTMARRGLHMRQFSGSAALSHDDLWPYFGESITWHADWLRLDAGSGEIKEHFRGLRDFRAKGDHSIQHNTYMYADERGTVDEGPLCGPWKIGDDCFTPNGMIHPARPQMRTLLAPDRSCVWLMPEVPAAETAQPFALELFLGDGANLRCSVGVVYDGTTRQISHVGVIREDARGFDTNEWKPSDTSFVRVETWNAVDYLHGSSGTQKPVVTKYTVSVPGPSVSQSKLTKLDDIQTHLSSLSVTNAQPESTCWQLPNGIHLVCPQQLPASNESFSMTVACQKMASIIQACYKHGHVEKIVHTAVKKQTWAAE